MSKGHGMTPIQLIELDATVSKATAGPWQVEGIRQKSLDIGDDTRFHMIGPDGDALAGVFYDMKTGRGLADAHAIVALFNAYPGLRTCIEDQAAEITRMSKALQEIADHRGRQKTTQRDGRLVETTHWYLQDIARAALTTSETA